MSRKRTNRRSGPSESFLDSWLFRFGSKLALGLFVVMVFLTLTQCTVKKPEAPTWTTQLTVPLVNRTYAMPEIIDKIDQDDIEISADSAVVYNFTRDIDTITLDADELTTSDLSYAVSEQLGAITIDAPAADSASVELAAIGSLATFIPGAVPVLSFDINNTMSPISSFSTATVSSGQIWAVISNELGIDLSALTIQMYDVSNAAVIGTQSFVGGLADGVTDSVAFNLAGQTVSNQLEIRLSATTASGTVLSAADKAIRTHMRFDGGLTVSSATAEVPALTRAFSQDVELGESDPVYQARLQNGNLVLDIENNTNLPAELEIGFPDLVQGAVQLSVTRSVTANSTSQVSIDLSGYDLVPTDSTVPQNIHIDVDATVPGSGTGQQVDIDQNDSFAISASLSNLAFESVTGLFSAVETAIDPRTEEIDLENGFDQLELVNAILTITIANGVNLPGSLDLLLEGDNGNTLNITGDVAAGSADSAVVSLIVDSTVASFFSPMPTSIDISGDASFGDGLTTGTITADDFIYAEINVLAPLEVRIDSAVIETDVESEELDIDNEIIDHIVVARFVYNISNHLPIGAQFQLYLSGDSATVLTDPELLIDEIAVPAAPVTAGIATDTITTGYQEVVLDSLELNVFENDSLYIGTLLMLEDTPPGETARLTINDYITITGRIEVEYNFDGDF